MPEIETQGDFQIQQYASIFMPRLLNKFQDKYSAIQSLKQENLQQNQFLNNINVAIDFQIFKKISSSSFKSQYNSDEPTNYYDTNRNEKDEEIQHQETIRQVSQVDQFKQAHQNEKKYSSYRCWAFFGLVLAFIFFAILFSVLFS
ncbi:hypothetical protein PPERSA_06435 [Pseudocohnilembus persalinus]|uniref:Transmembrane protein n=1 Tax=Pseudocohnilembus persalinus TaxID=266149 RepID=A0A0V0QRI6_PSEPJ|nr:hypothetical protein PPERSA_06435 [Pseudocohnilembus persalinus]|eukprot:KRX04801.1 hypothetical protein PPERSA_06435 [Pseudocohnilembus persalinus]